MVGAIGASHVVVGQDCTFGNRRRGTPELLREHRSRARLRRHRDRAGARRRRGLFLDPYPRAVEGRQAARGGGATRPFWEIDGRVAVGDHRGRTIGFPTANLGLGEYLRPAFGVYAVRVSGDGADDPLRGKTSTASPISACARPSARWCRDSRRISSTSTATSTGGICGWRWSISSVPSANFRASTS